ncbi:MAG: hypothetical protein RL464_921 [Actinomycetota bacterium]
MAAVNLTISKRSYLFRIILLLMWSKRGYVDFALKKRATIASITSDACDADPYLRRAAKFHGEETERDCPMCRKDKVTELQYVFGDQLGQYSGRIKTNDELDEMQSEYGEFRVYVVEICLGCGWNHLTASYLLGDGIERKPPRKVKTR